MNMITTIFASSDGCTPSEPMPSHRLAPFTGRPNSTATRARPTKPTPAQMNPRLPVSPVIDAHDDRHQQQAERREGGLFQQEQVRLVVLLERKQRRRAVDHDHARADEQQRGREQQLVRFQFSRHRLPKGPVASDREMFLNGAGAPDRMQLHKNAPRAGAASGRSLDRPHPPRITVSSQQSSAGRGLRHHPRRPGQPAFPADGSSPHRPD